MIALWCTPPRKTRLLAATIMLSSLAAVSHGHAQGSNVAPGPGARPSARDDVRTAMKARDKERASALRLIVDVLQQDAKLGKGDEVAVLQRERKKRVEAAEAYENAGRAEQAAAERFEAELIEGYLPQQLSDEELGQLVEAAVAETGASEQRQMGQVMSALMPKLGGRADGKRVSAAVREKLGA